jgi:aldehyde dehydrogenase (NAD+)
MENLQIEKIIIAQRTFFDLGKTKPYDFRIRQLINLKSVIKKNELEIIAALHADMHKPHFEAFISEIGILYEEIEYVLAHLKEWMKPLSVATPLALQPSSSRIYNEPLGLVLIIAPWNYPFQLLIAPLIGAIAAGNCSVLKPSDNTRHTARIIEKIIKETFDENYIAVIQGAGAIIGPQLIEKYRFDHVFFTGSANVGKQIMRMASEHLTPVTLELGGKSPAVVDKEVDIAIAAKRLIWSKCFNAGQTCVSPDYLLIHESIKDEFITKTIHCLKDFFGDNPLMSDHFTHIINTKRFNILISYLKDLHIIHGGKYDAATLCIEPTLVDAVPPGHPIMENEIFGPILPIFTFRNIEEVLPVIRKNRYPLACYLFTNNKHTEKYIIESVEFGGGCINNGLAHLANPKLPFGGVGFSGMGNYHGKNSFETFSHKKSVLKTKFLLDPPLRYPPYTATKDKWAHYFFR